MEFIAFDCHKRHTYAVVEDGQGRVKREGKILHDPGALVAFLVGCEPGSLVAVETVGNFGSWARSKKRAVFPGWST
ncbi:MAG: hypothetical protein QXQ66_08915 [Candidatus Hadarchaeum sp.]|uniref:hypothetical protein n=1 Tax=Candidatus Hadarchaeum sp. TaxID=2883567 RepID=UPI00316E7414